MRKECDFALSFLDGDSLDLGFPFFFCFVCVSCVFAAMAGQILIIVVKVPVDSV